MFISDFWLALVLVFFINLAGHFLPGFRKSLADSGAYVKSYIFGSGSILICAGIWAWLVNAWLYWLAFAAFFAAAGLGCITGYAIDLYANDRALRSADERDHAQN